MKNSVVHTLALFLILLATFAVTSQPALAVLFDNPLGSSSDTAGAVIIGILQRLILFIVTFAGFVALAALTYGGLRLILGGASSDQEVARAKQIIYWAIIGLVVIGLAAVILYNIRIILIPP
jgi:hypothetical protein